MLPPRLVAVLARLYEYFKYFDGQIGEIGKNLTHQLEEGDLGQRLLTIPGVGPIAAGVPSAELGDGKQYGLISYETPHWLCDD